MPEVGLAERLEGALHGALGDLGELGPEDAQARLGRLAHLDDLEADVLALPVMLGMLIGFQIIWTRLWIWIYLMSRI